MSLFLGEVVGCKVVPFNTCSTSWWSSEDIGVIISHSNDEILWLGWRYHGDKADNTYFLKDRNQMTSDCHANPIGLWKVQNSIL